MSLILPNRSHQTIPLSSLAGFAEDLVAAKLFQGRFKPQLWGVVTAGVAVGVFAALAAYARKHGDEVSVATFSLLAMVPFILSFILVFVGFRRMANAAPISPQSGKPMEIYRLEDTIKEDKYELIYVCRTSRTYFRRVFSQP